MTLYLYLKLALGNVRRSLRDFGVFFATLAFAACLLYAFVASTDYLLALDLTPQQRANYQESTNILQAFSIFIVIIFAFLIGYGQRFLVRRRKREFGLYALVGMEPRGVAAVLTLESAVVGVGALAAGIFAGAILSPAFGLVAAFVFDAPWRFMVTFSADAARWCAGCFAAIMAIAALATVRSIRKSTLVSLMAAERTPERPRATGTGTVRLQKAVAAALLAVVWGSCLFAPGYFIVFIIPMGFAAFGATYLIMRILCRSRAERARRRPERYFDGLRMFTVRQVEARVESSAAAMSCVAVLIAAAVCMIVAGLAFSVGMRASELVAAPMAMAPIGYVGLFYGAAFLVSAAAILALQQLTSAVESAGSYRVLEQLGAERALVRRSVRAQVAAVFVLPLGFALTHDIFGLALVGVLALLMDSVGYLLFAAGTVVFTMAVMGVYYLITTRACTRALVDRAGQPR